MRILERYLGTNIASNIVKIYYGTEQVYPLSVDLIVGSGVVTIEAFVPSLGVNLTLNANDLTFEGFATIGEVSSFSSLGDVTLQGFAAALGVNINVTSGSVTVNGLAPDSEILATSGVGAITVTGFAATVDTGSTLLNGLVTGYEMNNNWNDVLGSNNGTATGAVFTTSAKLGSHAGSFDGVNDYVSVSDANVFDFGTGDWSASAWIKTNTTANDYYFIFDKGRGSSGDGRITFGIYNDDRFFIHCYGSGSPDAFFSTHTSDDNDWHHIAVTVDRDANAVFYLDGVADSGVNISSNSSESVSSTQDLVIGARWNKNNHYWNGLIDSLHIWNRALTSDEVTELYNSGTGIEHPF